MSRSSKTAGNIIGTALGVAFFAAIVLFIGAFAFGYVTSIIQLFSCDWSEVDAKEALKIVGVIFVPIGAIMGWIG